MEKRIAGATSSVAVILGVFCKGCGSAKGVKKTARKELGEDRSGGCFAQALNERRRGLRLVRRVWRLLSTYRGDSPRRPEHHSFGSTTCSSNMDHKSPASAALQRSRLDPSQTLRLLRTELAMTGSRPKRRLASDTLELCPTQALREADIHDLLSTLLMPGGEFSFLIHLLRGRHACQTSFLTVSPLLLTHKVNPMKEINIIL